MSQAKVDAHKLEKKNRKKTLRKKKIANICTKIVGLCIAALLLFWVGDTIYDAVQDKKPAQTYYANLDAIEDYTDTLTATAE